MAAKIQTITARKRPVQARSRATVQALIEATAQILVAQGYERSTTDLVAERAGVSIGTLYQYFPNKEALVAALLGAHVEDILATSMAVLARHAGEPPEGILAALVRAGIEAHRLNPALHRVLTEQVPRAVYPPAALGIAEALQALIAQALETRVPELAPERRRMIAFVVESTVEALTHRAVVEAPDWLRCGALEAEAVALLRPYLLDALRPSN